MSDDRLSKLWDVSVAKQRLDIAKADRTVQLQAAAKSIDESIAALADTLERVTVAAVDAGNSISAVAKALGTTNRAAVRATVGSARRAGSDEGSEGAKAAGASPTDSAVKAA